jgi:hypothetical protein
LGADRSTDLRGDPAQAACEWRGKKFQVTGDRNTPSGKVLGDASKRTRALSLEMRRSHVDHTLGSQINQAHQQDPHDHENSLMGDHV